MEEKYQKAKIPKQIRAIVYSRDGRRCRYCGAKGVGVVLHCYHVYPEHKGGETSVDNLVTSCSWCNWKKRTMVGIWPKPIGYFDEYEKEHPYERLYTFFMWACSMVIFLGIVFDALSGFSAFDQVTTSAIGMYLCASGGIMMFLVFTAGQSGFFDRYKLKDESRDEVEVKHDPN